MKTNLVHPSRCAICALAARAARSEPHAAVVAALVVGAALRDKSAVDACVPCSARLGEAIRAHNRTQERAAADVH